MRLMTELQQHGSGPKTDRINIRLEPEIKKRIEKAAELDHRSITSFIIASAVDSAERVLKRNSPNQISLSEKDWDIFMSALENPPKPNAALRKAVLNYRKRNKKDD